MMIDIKILSDAQLNELSGLVKKEVGDRFRAKHCEGMFEFDGVPMPRTQAIEAFIEAKETIEKGLESALKKLSAKDKAYLTHMGELHQYAIRTKNDAGIKRLHDLMVEKLFEYRMADKTEAIIEQFYS
jgi:hypothetical protein